jgi:hypothetical protein
MARATLAAIFGTALFLIASSAFAYVWRCHTPNGDMWTSQPGPSDYCEEFDSIYNPGAAPPAMPSYPPPMAAPPPYPQLPAPSLNSTLIPPPPPPPPMYAYDPYPWPYAPYYPGFYGGSGIYFGLPGLVFDFRFGGGHGWHGRRWR